MDMVTKAKAKRDRFKANYKKPPPGMVSIAEILYDRLEEEEAKSPPKKKGGKDADG